MQFQIKPILKKTTSYLGQGFLIGLVLLTVFVTVTILLYWQTNVVADGVKKYLNTSFNDSTSIDYGTIKGTLFNSIYIDSIRFDQKDKIGLSAKKIELRYNLWPLIDDRIEISRVYIDSLSILKFPGPHKNKSKDENIKEPFILDSLLAQIQSSHFLDSLVNRLPEINLGELELVTGHLQIKDNGPTFENVYLNMALETRPGQINFQLKNLSGYWYERDLEIEDLHFQLIAKEGQLTLNNFLLEAGDSRIVLAGDLELETMQALIAIEEFHLDFKNFAGFLPVFEAGGSADGTISFIGSPQNFAINGDLKGQWRNHQLKQLKLVSSYNYGTIGIDTMRLNSTSGNFTLNSKIDPNKSASGRLTFDNIMPHTVDTSIAPSALNGYVNFDFPTGAFDINKLKHTIENFTGNGEVVIYDSYYQDFRLDSLRFALSAQRGNIGLVQPSFLKIANQARFEIMGFLNKGKQLDFQVRTAIGDLNSLTSALGQDSLFGTYHSEFRAYGNLNDPYIEGDFWINGFKYKDVLLDSIALNLQLSNILSTPSGIGNFLITAGNVYDIPIRNVALNAEVDSSKIHISNARIFSEDNYLESTLDILINENTVQVMIDKIRMEYEKYWLENSRNIGINIDSTRVVFDDLNLTGPGNTSFLASGAYDRAGNDLDLKLNLESLSLEPFQQFMGKKHRFKGIVTGKANLKNILTNPDVGVKMACSAIEYNDVAFGDFKADLSYDKEKVFIKELFMESGPSKLELSGDLSFQFDKKVGQLLDILRETNTNLKLNWTNIDLQKYNPLLKLKSPLRGNLDGYLEIEGTVDAPFMRQSLSMTGFNYGAFNVDSLVMFGQYSSGYMILDSLSADFNGTSFNLKGYQQLDLSFDSKDSVFTDNPFEFYLTSSDDKIEFVGLFNEQLEAIYGDYDLEMYISGTPEKPAISSGSVKMDKGKILLSRVKDPIEDVQVDVDIEDNILTINAFNGKSEEEQDLLQTAFSYVRKLWSWFLPKEKKKGTLIVDGTIDLENVMRPGIDLDIKMNQFFVDYFVENTKLLVTTKNLKIHGQDTVSVSGQLVLPSGEYIVNLEQMQKNMYLQKPATGSGKPYISMNLEIEMPGNFVITSSALDLQNNFKIVMRGNLQASREAGSENMSLIGLLETESGKFTSFNQSFNVTSGSIDFNNPLRINPDLNIVTRKSLKDKTFDLIISGNLESIQQNIIVRDSKGAELNLSQQDKIALLTLGADLSMVASKTDSTMRGVGEDIASNVVLTAAERGVEELTGLDKVEINSNDKFLDLQKLKLNNGLAQASISFGKYLTSDLYIEYRTQFGSGVPTPKLSWDAGNRITLQYRLNKLWSFESHYEKTVPQGNNKIKLGLSWEYSF